VIDVITQLNVNLESCTNHFVQYAGLEALLGDQSGHHEIVRTLRQRRDVLVRALGEIDGLVFHVPEVTFYLFPDVTEIFRRRGFTSTRAFRLDALERTGVSFCSRSHFGRPLPGEERIFIRLAYSGIDADRIPEGIGRLKAHWES
jgi:aspartate/methionine/tyrosine aminotransferase